MPKDHDKQRILTRRAVIFGGVQIAAFATLFSRLMYLQFFKAGEYATLSENNHIKLQPVAAERGRILDRVGAVIADNEKNYQLSIDASGLSADTYKATLARLNLLLQLPEKKMKQLQAVKPGAATPLQPVKDHLTWEEVSLVELHLLSLPGISIEVGQTRRYPLGERTAHLTGYLGAASPKEMEGDSEQALLRLPEFKVGKSGVEKMLEPKLRGRAAVRQLEVNVHGVVVRELGKSESTPGQDVRLTVDRRIQDAVAAKLGSQSGSAVVLDVTNGNILALASMPAFDPARFSLGIEAGEWKRLNSDKHIPLLNKALSGQYPPGSTFKMMVGLAGLKAGIIKPSFSVHCPGYFMLGNHRFGCWKPGGHGRVGYHEAVAQSCDTFFYTVAQKLGADPYADMARTCGLGRTYNIGLVGEKPGIIPDPKWKQDTYGQKWTGGDTINCSIGQGYVLATPLQLAVMAARLASGREIVPRLLVPKGGEDVVFARLPVDDQHLELTRAGMAAAVNEPGGTALGSRIYEPGMAFAGKTGTSQVRKLIQLGMNQNLLPWEFRHHGLFVGFAPLDKPRYAVAVVVEHGGSGSAAAAPVAREAMLAAQKIGEV